MSSELPDYEEVLRMLSEKAANGSVSALICLERALRPQAKTEDVDDALERILSSED